MADRHEALWLRLDALTRQVEAVAARRPEALVAEDLRLMAEDALFETARFRRLRPRRDLPVAADHYGPLAAQLGAARAELASFEARNTQWDTTLGAMAWQIGGAVLLVRRLKPKPVTKPVDQKTAQAEAARKAHMLDLRKRLAIRMDQFKRR